MKDSMNGWYIAALCFGLSALLQTWNLGYTYAKSECQAVQENNDEE